MIRSVAAAATAPRAKISLDEYQVSRYTPWYRHVTLAMLAHAFLAVTAATVTQNRGTTHARDGLVPLPSPKLDVCWHT